MFYLLMRKEIRIVAQWKVGLASGNRKALILFTKRVTLRSKTRTLNLKH